jgi:GTP-binding protein HflX
MKFDSNPIEEHHEAPLADEGRWEKIVARWTTQPSRPTSPDGGNACYVVSVAPHRERGNREAQLAEILGLVRAQGDEVVGHEVHQLKRPDPRTLIGRGTAEQIAGRANECGSNLLVIDAELSPSQTRNLEEATGFAVCDREAVILNVFLRHARSRKARIQVEIAHLEYLRPRICGVGLVMDQQAGGVMRGRGPGETASELMARQLDGRLAALRKGFTKLIRAGDVQRHGRDRCKRIALVGYTNAGKTTLMNGLTDEALAARSMPFETLDTTSRSLTRHGGTVLVSDTVGFIRRLPARLLASFESTFAEARDASLLALVVDVADFEWQLHLETTEHLLAKLDADTIPRFYIFNKVDRATSKPTAEILSRVARGHEYRCLCAHDVKAVTRLKEDLIRSVRTTQRRATVFVPYEASALMSLVYGKCRVLETEPGERGLRFTIEGNPDVVEKLERDTEDVQS